MHHSSTSTYTPNFIEIEETFCGRTDVRTDVQTFETHFIRSTRRSRPNNYKYQNWQYIQQSHTLTQKQNVPVIIYCLADIQPKTSKLSVRVKQDLVYLNLRPRCWFILARGATPSTAIKKTFRGFIIRNSTWQSRQKTSVLRRLQRTMLATVKSHATHFKFWGPNDISKTRIVKFCTQIGCIKSWPTDNKVPI